MTIASAREDAFEIIGGDLSAGALILCDHAMNRIPEDYAQLGLSEPELNRHIAFDIGTEPLARMLAERLRAPAVLSRYSRLLIDPNRGEDDPTLIMRLSDGAIVPGNRAVDTAEREHRLNRFYRPYHAAIEDILDRAIAANHAPAVVSLHSFTPEWKNAPRPWHAGILWDRDPRLAKPLIERLSAVHGLFVGDNEPYSGALQNDTMYRHCTLRGVAHALVEIRNDLIATAGGVMEWADRLNAVLDEVLESRDLYKIIHHGSAVGPAAEP